MARNKKVEILSNDKEVLHPMTDGDCVIFEDGQTLTQKLSEDDSVKYTPEIVNSSPMFKVGEGNTVDYSDNVLDGAYERATLQGQTYVNYIQESSADEVTLPTPFTEYERTQHNTLTSDEEGTLGINLVGQSYVNALQHDSEEEYVVLGESLEFQEKKVEYTNEGQIKSAMLKGQTLVNLIQEFQNRTVGAILETQDDYLLHTVILEDAWYQLVAPSSGMVKPSTQYLLVIDVVENTLSTPMYVVGNLEHNKFIYSTDAIQPNTTGIFKFKLTSKSAFTLDTEQNNDLFFQYGQEEIVGNKIKLRAMLIEYQEGMENWDIPYFEGMQSVTVSTKLENLCNRQNSSTAKNGKTFNTNSLNDRLIVLNGVTDGGATSYGMKPNTKYLIQFKVSNLVLDGLSALTLTFSTSTVDTGNCLFTPGTVENLVTSNGVYRVVLTTSNLISTSSVEIKGLSTQWEDSGSTLRSMTISNIMYVEYQNGMENWDLPYFEDYQVMKPVQVESVNKNLFDKNNFILNKGLAWADGSFVTINNQGQQASESYVPINYNSTYIMTGLQNGLVVCVYDHNKNIVGFLNNDGRTIANLGDVAGTAITSFNLSNYPQSKYVRFCVRGDGSQNTQDISNIQIEESDTVTEYTPHQSKTTYSWDEVILRKVGDVEDTLDLTTGEWVQRIGEIILNGSDDETWQQSDETWQQVTLDTWTKTNGVQDSCGYIYYFQHNYKAVDYITFHEQESNLYTLCDKLPVSGFNIELSSKTNVCVAGGATPSAIQNGTINGYIGIKLDTTKATTVDEFKAWLKQNPLKVHVVMSKPIVHKVNLSRPNLQVYDDITHVHTKCLDGTLIPNIYLPSDISYPAILEPSTTYNVSINHTQVSADNPLKVNVGGTEITMTDSRMTLTTPATLANSNVSFTGKGNKIKESMLIKNSSLLTRDLPHFNGIGSVQLGKTIENLCGSNCYGVGTATFTEVPYNDKIVVTVTKQGSLVYVFELTRQLENGKQYYVYVPNTYPTNYQGIVGFRKMYNGTLTFAAGAPSDGVQKSSIIEINQTDNPYTHLTFGRHGGDLPVNTVIELQRPIICEYEQGMENWDWESIGYFTGTKNIGNEFMKVQNKNLFDMKKVAKDLNSIQETITENSNTSWTIVSTNLYSQSEYVYKPITFKENTRYTISMDFTTSDTTKHGTVLQFNYTDGSSQYIYPYKKTTISDGNKTIKNITFTFGYKNITETISNIQLEESSTATTYTAHKHNGLYITKDQPIDLTWEQGKAQGNIGESYTVCTNNVLSTQIRPKGLINLKPNTTYRISLGNTNYRYHLSSFDNNDCHISSIGVGLHDNWNFTDSYFTTTKNIHKFAINISKVDNTNITPSEINHIRLEEVTDVVLRGIGDVHDELDITRGIYTQRIGEIVLDGSNDEIWYPSGLNQNLLDAGRKNLVFYYNHENNGTLANLKLSPYSEMSSIISDKLAQITHEQQIAANTIYDFPSVTGGIGVPELRIAIPVENSTTQQDSATCKAWLKENPIKVQYELATPIVHKVHIGNKNETNAEVTKPNDVFTLPTLYTEQTHIDLTNNGIMPKVQSRDYIAYPVLPMVSRTYTLQHNLTGGVSNLTVDLLGRTQSVSYQNHKSLVYTPTTMDAKLHDELRISGKGKISKVMYIDGGYMDRDIPYIEGMKNACNPIVKNIGKNLFSGDLGVFDVKVIRLDAPIKKGSYYISGTPNTLYTTAPVVVVENKTLNQSKYGYINNVFNINFNIEKITIYSNGYSYYNSIGKTLSIPDFMISENQVNYEPYKENICYVDCGEIRLTPDMFEQGSISNLGTSYNDDKSNATDRIRTKGLIELEPNEQYVILGNTSTYKYSAHFYDMEGNGVKVSYDLSWKANKPFTVPSDAPMVAFFVAYQYNRNFTVNDVDFNFQLVKVSEIKQMRSLPNGVHDEIDLETGKYIQRIGEVVLDGSSDEFWKTYQTNDYGLCQMYTETSDYAFPNHYTVSDKLPNINDGFGNVKIPSIRVPESKGIYIRLKQEWLYESSEIGFKQYLSENPITVQYELAEPIVKDIVIHNYPHSYEGGHVIIESGDPSTPIPAQLTYRAVTNRSGQIQQHTEQVEKQEREINELETLILANIHLSQTR